MAQADQSGTRLGDAMVYINYNTTAFGDSIEVKAKIIVTKGTLISGDISSVPIYTIVKTDDHTSSRVVITTSYDFSTQPSLANLLPTTPTSYVHIKIEIATPVSAGLSFEQSLMAGQEYESDNTTKYNPVIASDTDNTVVPVELSSFTASVFDGNVRLNWTTHTETNNLGFTVERSENGTEFQEIGFVEGKGTTVIPQEYFFEDKNLAPGTYFYRLKQIDLDGAFEYSDVINATVLAPKEFALSQNYPNPFNPETTIRYELPISTHVILKIYNILGEEVRTIVNAEQPAGIRTVVWDGKNNAGEYVGSGLYYYRLVAGDYTKTLKLLLMR
ncbi:MAG: FlgD immunoglobulin-like domain containing protein [bacterium]